MTRPNGSYDPPRVSVEDVQRFLGRGRDAWTPRDGETWEAFVRRKAAPHAPGWWSPFARAAFRRALGEALARGEHRRSTRALVLPFWVANNEDEVERDDAWKKAAVVVSEPDDELLLEMDLRGDEAVWARVSLTTIAGAFVGLSRSYAPDVTSVKRFGPFCVVDAKLRAIIDEVLAGERVTPTPSPAEPVPGFSARYVPAFDLAAAAADVREAAQRLSKKLSYQPT